MKKAALLIASFGLLTYAQAQVYQHVYNSFDGLPQQQEWTMYRAGETGIYAWEFTTVGPYTAPGSLYHGYPVGGTNLTDDWCVSQPFLMNHGGRIDSIRHNFSGFGVPGAGDTVALYLLVGSPDPGLAGAKILLHDFRNADYVGDGQWRLTTNIEIPATLGTCYVAFRYSTVVNWLTVKFDNISISSLQYAGVNEHGSTGALLYPNPTDGYIHIRSDHTEKLRLDVYDLTGKHVLATQVNGGQSIRLELNEGIYHYRISHPNGLILAKDKIVVANR